MLTRGVDFKKDTKVTLTFSNPAAYNIRLQLLQVEGKIGESVTAKVSVNKGCGLPELHYKKDIKVSLTFSTLLPTM